MADLTITSANVKGSLDAKKVTGVAGAAIAAGQALYRDTDGTYKLAIASTQTEADFKGISLCGAATGQPVTFAKHDPDLDLGASLAVGEAYCVSASVAGAIAPIGDLSTGAYVTVVGISNATDSIYITTESGNHSTAAKV